MKIIRNNGYKKLRRDKMIYYLFSEKERMELEGLLINEMNLIGELLNKGEVIGRRDMVKIRALNERRELLLNVYEKISNNKQKSFNL
jgi:hypothetical protein